MSFGIDYAWGSPSTSGLKSNGVKFVCRYVSTPGNSKNISKAEAQRISSAGIDIVLVFERTAGRALAGKNAGAADARSALSQAQAVGIPKDRPIYFAVDFDASQSQQGAINFYFQGVNSVLDKDRSGCYGGYWVVKRLFDAKLIKYGWQTYAWSGGNWDKRAQLQQYSNDHSLAGVSCDFDRSTASDFGQWRIGHGGPTSLPKHKNNSRKLSEGATGTDVRHFQAELNNRLRARRKPKIDTDGSYGPKTEAAKKDATYFLGFPDGVVARKGATPKVQDYIDTPTKRPRSYVERAKKRKAAGKGAKVVDFKPKAPEAIEKLKTEVADVKERIAAVRLPSDIHAKSLPERNPVKLSTPSITAAQVVAIVGAVIGVLVAFGVDISGGQREAVVGLVALVSSVLIVGDAHVRQGRAKAHAIVTAAKIQRRGD